MIKGKGTFPNYLLNTSAHDEKETEKSERQSQHTTFVASDMHGATPSVPFLREHKHSFQRYQKENPEAKIRKDYISEERKRQREENSEKASQVFSFYKSRRPFRASEIPSIWNTNPRDEKGSTDYSRIKEQLYVNDADLILVDLNLSTDHEKKSTVSRKTNKALHRSLGLIMEQEQAHSWSQREIVQQTPISNGVKSFFDEMTET